MRPASLFREALVVSLCVAVGAFFAIRWNDMRPPQHGCIAFGNAQSGGCF